MTSKSLRTRHRSVGIPLALFVAIQTVTGIVLTFDRYLGFYRQGLADELHYDVSLIGVIYRSALGVGLLWMTVTGLMIWWDIRQRRKRAAS